MAVKTEVKLSKISYVILFVPNAKESIPFYRDKLGMTVKLQDDHDEGWVELESGATTLALHSSNEVPKEKRAAMPNVVFEVENIKEAYKQLKEKGVKFTQEPKEVCSTPDGIGYSADFEDPHGNVLSIYGMEAKKS